MDFKCDLGNIYQPFFNTKANQNLNKKSLNFLVKGPKCGGPIIKKKKTSNKVLE